MRVTIRVKLLGNTLFLLGLMAIVSLIALHSMERVKQETRLLYEGEVAGLTQLAKVRYHAMSVRYAAAMVVSQQGAEAARTVDNGHKDEQLLLENLAVYERLQRSPGDVELAAQLRGAIQAYLPAKELTYQLALQGRTQAARENMVRHAGVKFRTVADLLKQTFERTEAQARSRYEGVAATAERNRNLTALLLLVLSGTGLGSGYWLANSIARATRGIARAAQGIAAGDLDQVVAIRSDDELGDMAKSFQQMIDYLKEMAGAADAVSRGELGVSIRPRGERDALGGAVSRMVENLRRIASRVRAAADVVGSDAQQIAGSSVELSGSVAVQAASVEETSAAMEEMAVNFRAMDQSAQTLDYKVAIVRVQSDELAVAVTQTSRSIAEFAARVEQVAGNVSHANHLAEQASETAYAGSEAVTKVTLGMNAIAETMDGIRTTIQDLDRRSGEIGAIIEVIDDIAEQTNLLALNAAIEAARAGEAGRGFAVVADEVRRLAERSAKATKEIGALVLGIQQETAQAVGVTQAGAARVQEGVLLTGHTGNALEKIQAAVQQVSGLLGEVAVATSEQTRAGQQIVLVAEQMAATNHQVTGTVVEMDQLTRDVTYATGEQRQSAEQVVIAVESLSMSSRAAAAATERVSQAAAALNEQAHLLQEAIAFFKDDESVPHRAASGPALCRNLIEGFVRLA